MKTKISSIFVLCTLLFASCNDDVPSPGKIDLDDKSKELIEADHTFGLEMYSRLSATTDQNVVISPLSVSLALAMTYNGAKGETKTDMEEAMKLAGLKTEEINQSYQSLMKALLEVDPKVTMEIAQSIWYRKDYTVLNEFKQVNQTYYDAEVKELDFSRSDAKDIMNKWIEDKTHDKIKDMIKSVDPDHVMFLINALYFKGTWRTQFKKSSTFNGTFTKEDGKTITVKMMSKEDSVNHLSNTLFAAIEMPYGRGNYNMVVILPGEGKRVADVEAQLTHANWKKWMNDFRMTREMNIQLPKFKNEYEKRLNQVLTDMGMGVAFTGAADFSGINGYGNIFIDYVQHNTFIDVNEEGTEAAAATVVAMRETAMLENNFFVNRPFLFAITEKETGAILFIGKIMEPKYN
jgi:serine protease inhibitor